MSIFKDTFKEGVQNQLKARQKAIFERTPDAIQYFNARNSWIRVTSAVNVGQNEPGLSTLAENYVLLGGTLYNGKLRSGVGIGNQAYSLNSITANANGTIKQEPNRLGIRPMPGITSIDVKSKSAYGSLREVTINFQCWDIRQLEELELLYMRPGYSVLVEWGWAPYLDNNGKLQGNISFIDDVLKGGVSKEQIWKNIFTKASKDGNYDAHYGFVKNYSWSARPDGGYDCTSTIISIGEILESLKVNYGAHDTDVATNGLFNKLPTPFGKDSNVRKSYSQNKIAGICNELYLTLLKEGISDKEEKTFNGWTFFRFNVDVSNSPNTDSDFDDEAQIYILLKDFVDILNKHVLLKDIKSETPMVRVSVNEGDHMGGENKPLLCLGHILQLSIDPSTCLIKNDAWLNPSSLGFAEGFSDDFSTLKGILKGLKTSYWHNGDYTNQQLGVIGNIYVNLGYIYSLVNNKNLESQDKKEKNDIILFDFLKNMMSGISTSIGNVATFDIFSDPIDSSARIIDINYADDQNREEAYNNAFMFELQNTKSVIRNYKFESQIFPDQTTTIAIGAQAKGGALGTDVNTLIDFNQNLFDRIIPKKDAPDTPSYTDPAKELEEKIKNLKENINIIVSFINEIDPAWYKFGLGSGNYDTSNASKYSNALKDLINFFKTFIKNDNTNRAIIPTKLSIETDGIGGMVIGNLFRIPNELLPRGYRGGGAGPAKIAYAVIGLGHSLQNNDWVTNVDSQFIILDEPRGGISLIDMSSIKIVIEAAANESTKKATEIIKNTLPSTYIPGTNKGNVINYNVNNSGKQTPNSIVLHCTAGYGSALSTVNFVNQKLSIHYAVDREGNVVQGMDENLTGWHANNKNPGSIGIEIANIFSGYRKDKQILMDATNKPLAKNTGTTLVDLGWNYNNRSIFEEYSDVQITALENLIKGIITRNPGIKLNFTKDINTIYQNVFGLPGIPEKGKSYYTQKPNNGKGALPKDPGIFTHVICAGSGHGDPPPTPKIINMLQRIA